MSVVYKGRVFSVEAGRQRFPDGSEHSVEIVRHAPSVVIIPMSDAGHVVMIRQYRAPLDREIWELPAGSVNAAGVAGTAAVPAGATGFGRSSTRAGAGSGNKAGACPVDGSDKTGAADDWLSETPAGSDRWAATDSRKRATASSLTATLRTPAALRRRSSSVRACNASRTISLSG